MGGTLSFRCSIIYSVIIAISDLQMISTFDTDKEFNKI